MDNKKMAQAKMFMDSLSENGLLDYMDYPSAPGPKVRDSRSEQDIQERLSKQQAKLARRALRNKPTGNN